MAAPIGGSPSSDPILVLIHGTFSDTSGSFGKLWSEHPDYIDKIFAHYGGKVYALDHPTLGMSPVQNAQMLVDSLPANSHLHLLTHSRGGLVAEVLAKVCARPVAIDETIFKDDLQLLADLKALAASVAQKGMTVERIVRVACPARGTLLASNRLDAYLSVLKWSLELAQVPVAPELVELLTGVAQTGLDPKVAPGLAALVPDSALIRWVHSPAAPLPGDLRVVSGDVKGDSITSWLKTLLSDAFFWTDNDLIVQTRSMYGGTPRQNPASFLFDKGGDVSHFRYFTNPLTAKAITDALIEHTTPADFRTIGPLSWAGEDSGGVRGAAPVSDPSKPALFVLPGILGSNLKVGDERVWLSWRIVNGIDRLEYIDNAAQQPASPIAPDGPIGLTYDKLIAFLGATHSVTPFAFDWRIPIEREAERLAATVAEALDARAQSRQPVRIIAHSMGGLVLRAMQMTSPNIWQRLVDAEGARILMLGTPNGGSWAPMQVLSGDDTFGNTLSAVGSLFDAAKSRRIMAQMPGFLQLQAGLLDPSRKLDRAEGWQALANKDMESVKAASIWHSLDAQTRLCEWGLPSDPVLAAAKALRVKFDAQRGQLAALARNKLVLVVGEAKFTPDGYDDNGDKGLVYLNAIDVGDGRVTLDNAMLPGVPTWRTPHDHGSLPKAEDAFDAYLDLLRTGSTSRLTLVSDSGASRGADALKKVLTTQYQLVRPSRAGMDTLPASGESEMMSPQVSDDSRPSADLTLSIKVINGNVRFVEGPLLVGHYGPAVLTGAEIVMDKLLGGRLSKALRVGRYPEAVGTQQIFINGCVNPHNPFTTSQPSAVIVVGLGEEGKLGAEGLVRTVRQGVISLSQRMEEQQADSNRDLALTATLLASGGMSVSPGDAAQSLVRGVCEANQLLGLSGSPRVTRLNLIDIYLDRATEAWLAVKALPPIPGVRFEIDEAIARGVGGLRRPLDANYRSAGYDMISVTARRDEFGRTCIVYAMDTRRARGELQPKSIQLGLLRKLVATSSLEQASDLQVGRTLFQLVVPFELRPHLGGKTDIVLSLDETTAGIPWELLQTPDDSDASGGEPWSIRSQLLRKLQTVNYRSHVTDVQRDGDMLIVGEPKVDLTRYMQLPGASAEAQCVYELARANPDLISVGRIKALIRGGEYPDGPDANTVINTLFARNWRVVHIAGHGEPPEEPTVADPDVPGSRSVKGKLRGVVLSDEIYLGADEIEAVGVVPELVFVNCCHLGQPEKNQLPDADATLSDRPRFAATVAESLIRIGVRCVIACGWAVDDAAASTFARAFYEQLFAGKRFIDAVGKARSEARKHGGNTWAAYQCYGDPDWTFRSQLPVTLPKPTSSEKLYAAVASPAALVLALEHLSLAARYDESEPSQQVERIRYLESRFRPRYGESGKVAEAFAQAWREVGCDENAETWYARAVHARDGSASFESGAEWARIRARIALKRFLSTSPANANANAMQVSNIINASIKEVTEAAQLLETLSALRPSVKMETLTGSAWRRLARIEWGTRAPGAFSTNGIDKAVLHYRKAVGISQDARSDMLFLPALKYLTASTVQALWKNGDQPDPLRDGYTDQLIPEIYLSLNQKMQRQSDFWSRAAFNGVRICDAVDKKQLAQDMEAMLAFYEKLHAIASAPKFWLPVYQQAEFVLSNYQGITTNCDERNAAASIKDRLSQWSGVGSPSVVQPANGP